MNNHIENCPIEPVVSIISGKWTSYILWEIYNGNNHYGSIIKSLPGISTKTLSTRLKMLESKNIISRTVIDSNPPTVFYEFTKPGIALAPILQSMKDWSNQYSKK